MTKTEFYFHNDRPQLVDNFIKEGDVDTRIYAYELQEKCASGTHICWEFLKDHRDLFEDTGFWHVYDEEIYEDDRGYEHLYSMTGFGVIIKEDKVKEFDSYPSHI